MRQKNNPRDDIPKRPRSAPKRMKPLTLGDLAKQGLIEIEAECEWCRHSAMLEIAPLIENEGSTQPFRRIAERLKCSVCGWHQVSAWPVRSNHKPRSRTKPAPLPSLDECRNLLITASPDSTMLAHERHAALMRALMERWPEPDASHALFIVRALVPEFPR